MPQVAKEILEETGSELVQVVNISLPGKRRRCVLPRERSQEHLEWPTGLVDVPVERLKIISQEAVERIRERETS